GDLAGSPGGFSRITGDGPHHRLADLECRYGRMLVFASDEVIGRSLVLYGEWAEHELRCLRPYIRPGSTVIDVGAYVGTHALPFSLWAGAGRVVAIEVQPVASSVLTVNCLRNERWNVQIINAICSTRRGFLSVSIDYENMQNFGGVSFAASERSW